MIDRLGDVGGARLPASGSGRAAAGAGGSGLRLPRRGGWRCYVPRAMSRRRGPTSVPPCGPGTGGLSARVTPTRPEALAEMVVGLHDERGEAVGDRAAEVIGNEAERRGADVGGLRVAGEPAPGVEVLALSGVARAGSEQRVPVGVGVPPACRSQATACGDLGVCAVPC